VRAGVVAGVDGCRTGWLYVAQDLRSGRCSAGVLLRIDELLLLDPVPSAVAIDIPIGLTESGSRGCDQEARKLLGRPRSSSVFPAPIRPMLSASSYTQACGIGWRADGRKVNRQTWNIAPKIAQVDVFLAAHPWLRENIHEAHPEVSFWRWNGGRAMEFGKKTGQGQAERRSLVVSQFPYAAVRESLPRGGWGEDDLLDAFAVLWTAKRVALGAAIAVPPGAPADGLGLRMEIVS
jgi:predicted RNase H-like nuclease